MIVAAYLVNKTWRVSASVMHLQLKTIECMDVAEQSLQALEKLSHKHGRIILHLVCVIQFWLVVSRCIC